jgi:hypothetical protein
VGLPVFLAGEPVEFFGFGFEDGVVFLVLLVAGFTDAFVGDRFVPAFVVDFPLFRVDGAAFFEVFDFVSAGKGD